MNKGIMRKGVKKKYVKTAKELCYSKEIIEKLENATTENECIFILRSARKGTLE